MEQEAKLTLLRDRITSHCITLILIGQTIKLPGKSQNQENRGLFAHQPPIGLQYKTTCSTSNTKTEHKYAPWCDHKPLRMSAVSRVALLKSTGNRGRHDVRVAPNGRVLAGLSNAYVAHPIGEHQLVSSDSAQDRLRRGERQAHQLCLSQYRPACSSRVQRKGFGSCGNSQTRRGSSRGRDTRRRRRRWWWWWRWWWRRSSWHLQNQTRGSRLGSL